MPSKPTTRWQVSGYRFLVRRMEHALVRRDVRMLHDPMRSQTRAYLVGLVLACVVLAGCGILALLRPQDKIANNQILIGKESGAVYVQINGVVHPTLNLASARLAAGKPTKAVIVKESELKKKPRGQLIGIPGAPGYLSFDEDAKGRAWTVCDSLKTDGSNKVDTSSVLIGDLDPGDWASTVPADKALLVQGKEGTYLVYDNKRAKVNMSDAAVVEALHIRGQVPRPVSPGVLNAFREVLAIKAPDIDNRGGTPAYAVGDHKIGEVVKEPDSGDTWVVLRDGLQAISQLTADIIRNSDPDATRNPTIGSYESSHAAKVDTLPVGDYPKTAPSIIQSKEQPVSCASWEPVTAGASGGVHAKVSMITGVRLPMPKSAKLVSLAQADADGPNVDSVYFKPGSGAYVQATGIEPDSQRRDSLFYISDTGVRYGVKDGEAAKALGMDPEKVKGELAPWPIVGLLPTGPGLGRQEAMVAHDGVAPDPSPAQSLVPTGEP